MPTLPALDITSKANYSPHVIILGAGASLAACPRGDRHGRRLPLMSTLTATLGLDPLLSKAGINVGPADNFEQVYDRISSSDKFFDLRCDVNHAVQNYFATLELPEHATIYDRLLLSLRPKDLIATFNWDPFLLQAYARNCHLGELPQVVFLHGNVYLGHCPDHRTKGYSTQQCNTCNKPLQPSPILFPIGQKDYRSHPLLVAEWDEFSKTVEHAYLLTIFGYAAPASDAAAREILLKAWSGNGTRELAQIEVIDILGQRALTARWKDFIVRDHVGAIRRFSQSYQYHFPRRSCEAFAFASLQQDPWATRPLPRTRALSRLQEWVEPLINEERALARDGTALVPFRRTNKRELPP